MEQLLPEGLAVYPAIALIIASFFTSALTAAVGIGGGLSMLALMAYVIPPFALIPVHGLVQLGSNASRAHLSATAHKLVCGCTVSGSVLPVGASLGAMIAVQLPARPAADHSGSFHPVDRVDFSSNHREGQALTHWCRWFSHYISDDFCRCNRAAYGASL